MEDAELAAIRAARLNQLQQQGGGSARPSQVGGFTGGDSNEGGEDANRQSEDQMKGENTQHSKRK